MALQGDYEPSPEAWVRDQVAAYESSGGAERNTLRGVPVVVVTSVGARSGKLRKNPLMRVEHDGEYALVASNGGAASHPTWYHNLVRHPVVDLQDGADRAEYTVSLARGEERARWWERAVAVWPDYADYQTRTEREIPVFIARRADRDAGGTSAAAS
jgi:deazaflavin-dependent oxidoreductase (nitroreductase family)